MVPLPLIPFLMLVRWLPESQAFQREASVPLRTLFRLCPGQAAATLLLWLGAFSPCWWSYMLINWLPMLLVGPGFPPARRRG